MLIVWIPSMDFLSKDEVITRTLGGAQDRRSFVLQTHLLDLCELKGWEPLLFPFSLSIPRFPFMLLENKKCNSIPYQITLSYCNVELTLGTTSTLYVLLLRILILPLSWTPPPRRLLAPGRDPT
ncbi:hypothetical protein J6590_076432 [Homalodisca vitripennis]|nr:hypothetical protein J6590_076432 [Homalodisca vitripennis]